MKIKILLSRVVAVLLICIGGFGCAHLRNRSGSGTAIHQVGLVWLKQAGDAQARQRIIDAVHEFEESIPEVKSALVGETDGVDGPYSDTSYDVCFILTFKDEASRQRYAEHPVHQKAATNVFLPLSRKLLFYRFISPGQASRGQRPRTMHRPPSRPTGAAQVQVSRLGRLRHLGALSGLRGVQSIKV